MNRITIAFFALFTCLLLSNAQVSLHYNSNTDNIVDRVRGKERDMESGSTLRINNNGIINLRDGVVFNPPIGANVYVNYGEIR